MSDYRPVFDEPAGGSRVLRVLLAVVLLLGAGAAMDRWLLPHPNRAAAPAASAVTPEQPSEAAQRFPATVRGAGDAAADLETQLTAATGRPADETRARIAALLAPDAAALADRLAAGATNSAAPGGIRQTVIARVWADDAGAGRPGRIDALAPRPRPAGGLTRPGRPATLVDTCQWIGR